MVYVESEHRPSGSPALVREVGDQGDVPRPAGPYPAPNAVRAPRAATTQAPIAYWRADAAECLFPKRGRSVASPPGSRYPLHLAPRSPFLTYFARAMTTAPDDATPKSAALVQLLRTIPSIESSVGAGVDQERWWVKFSIDIAHPLAWRVVQELGHVINYLSLDERLPAVFMPVSPPPYLNGGPSGFLSWVIENTDPNFTSEQLARVLEARLPSPIDDREAWIEED